MGGWNDRPLPRWLLGFDGKNWRGTLLKYPALERQPLAGHHGERIGRQRACYKNGECVYTFVQTRTVGWPTANPTKTDSTVCMRVDVRVPSFVLEVHTYPVLSLWAPPPF